MISIEPYSLDHISRHAEAAQESHATVFPWLAWCKADYQQLDSRDWIEHCMQAYLKNEKWEFAIIDSESQDFLGGVGLNFPNRVNGNLVNLGYWVRSGRAGGNIATMASRVALDFAFNQLEFERVEIMASTLNHASNRVAEKLGAIREGTLRSRLLVHGKYHSAAIYSILRNEWQKQK